MYAVELTSTRRNRKSSDLCRSNGGVVVIPWVDPMPRDQMTYCVKGRQGHQHD